MKTPFWAVRYAKERTLFEIVRVIEYSSKGAVSDRWIGSIYYGPSRIQKRLKRLNYNTFRKNYRSVNTLPDKLKYNLIMSAFQGDRR